MINEVSTALKDYGENAINETINQAIYDESGQELFCKNCQQYGACDMNADKPRILNCNLIAIKYAIDANNGGVPFGQLDIMNRPATFNTLVDIARSGLGKR